MKTDYLYRIIKKPMPKKTYTFMLTDKDRKRHEHIIEKGRITKFVVQYETFIEDK